MADRLQGGGGGDRALLELQIHPRDIRKRVRYLFLTRRQLTAAAAAAGLYLLVVATALALAVPVLGALWQAHEHRELVAERAGHHQRTAALVAELERLDDDAADLRVRIEKVFMVYGLPEQLAGGQGGYPFDDAAAPEAGETSEAARGVAAGRRVLRSVSEQLGVASAFLDEIQAFERAKSDQVRTTPSIMPLDADFQLTSPFGMRRNPFTGRRSFHAGLDLAAFEGTPIHAPADGEVIFAGRYSLQKSVGWWRYGNLVMIAHGDDFVTLFGHCDTVEVEAGDRVERGDVIARVGSTGMSTSPHLHYEVRRRGADGEMRPVDPRIYILDHRWSDEERLLVASREAPPARDFQPLPRLLGR